MAEARKTVTVVFADVSGSTELGERLDPEALRRIMERYFSTARAALERHGGTVEKFIGDAVVAVFGIPAAREDDALRAVKAAIELRDAMARLSADLERDLGVTLGVRTGVNTGEVVAGEPADGQFYATGDAVNVAARLEQAAEPGDILIGEATHRLVNDVVQVETSAPLRLKGKTELVTAYRLVASIPGAAPVARRLDTPFVGRTRQLARLRDFFDRSAALGRPGLVTILGPAGMGKTRLAAEFVAEIEGEARVLQGRCLSYGEGITFWPLEEIVRSLAERPLDTPDPGRATSTEETFWAYRKLFEALAREQPLLLVLEDIHWAEPTLLDLIEHVVEWTSDARMAVLCLARPELLDDRPGWSGERVELEPLSEEEADTLAAAVGGGTGPALQARAVSVAEGNPLFLEQLLALAAEDGEERGIPDTIQAILAARLDRLETEERRLLEAAAVVGKEFWRGALLHLSAPGTEVSALLQRLVRRGLVRPIRSSLPAEDAFRFGHILIRDAAYTAISKETRIELHEGFAGWLEDRDSPYEEIVGHHLEKAFEYRVELGLRDVRAARLRGRAGIALATAGHRAFGRGDSLAAANLLERACRHLDPADPARLEALIALGLALFGLGRSEEADAALSEAMRIAVDEGDEELAWRARLDRTYVRAQFDPGSGLNNEMEREARDAVSAFEALASERGLGRAWRQIAQVRSWSGRHEEAAAAAERATDFARRAGDRYEESWALRILTVALDAGPTPVPEAVERCEQILDRAREDPELLGGVLRILSCLHELNGDLEEATRLADEAVGIYEDLGLPFRLAVVLGFARARIHFARGDTNAAEADLRRANEILDSIGEQGARSTISALLANHLAREGRSAEARALLRFSEAAAIDDDWLTSMVVWSARACLSAAAGELAEAVDLARRAVAVADGTDDLEARASIRLDAADVLTLSGDLGGAAQLGEEALELFARKGASGRVVRARTRLAELRSRAGSLPA